MRKPHRIILSRTDNLGDVVLTLPMAGYIKQQLPEAVVYFIGKSYTRPLIEASAHVDHFLDREAILSEPAVLTTLEVDAIIFVFPDRELAKLARQAGIPVRVGTSHRWFHWLYLNQLVNLSRRNSDLHEAQLNLQLLRPLDLPVQVETGQIPQWYGLEKLPAFPHPNWFKPGLFHLILHPKSKGSAREWPLASYLALAKSLAADKFQLVVTGTAAEGALIRQQNPALLEQPHVTDLAGKLSLPELIGLIGLVDGLVACSTGPLHIAAALGKFALGIYPPMRPLHPGRWGPLGKRATFLTLPKNCSDCRKTQDCACIRSISVTQVKEVIEGWRKEKAFSNINH